MYATSVKYMIVSYDIVGDYNNFLLYQFFAILSYIFIGSNLTIFFTFCIVHDNSISTENLFALISDTLTEDDSILRYGSIDNTLI